MFLCPTTCCQEAPLQNIWKTKNQGVEWVGLGLPITAKHNLRCGIFWSVSPFCITKTFYIISLRNKPLLGLCGMCRYYRDSGQPENSPSPAPTSVCASCVSLVWEWGVGPCPSSVSLFCQDRLEATVSRGCFTPRPPGLSP